MQVKEFTFNGYHATVILPKKPNGKWIWKTEFLYAFDQAERALSERGYTRVYYAVSGKYGSYHAVRLMRRFYDFVVKEFSLRKKCNLFGFSRGGLYAFNFALFYPELVEKIYLDAPVLDLKSWPTQGSPEQAQMFAEYGLNEETLLVFKGNPVDNLAEFFTLDIPLMVVAGDEDETVPLCENAGGLLDYAKVNGFAVKSVIKAGCGHHPHSLEDVSPIIEFIEK